MSEGISVVSISYSILKESLWPEVSHEERHFICSATFFRQFCDMFLDVSKIIVYFVD